MSYKNYLNTQVDKCVKNQNLPHPPRNVDSNASVLHFKQSMFLNKKYILLDKAVTESDEPFLFNEETHVDKPFDSSVQRHRFFQNLHLSVPVPENRSEAALMTDAARLVQKMRPQLKEYHTSAQKREFKSKVANIARIQPSLVDFIYSELAFDGSAMEYPEMQQRFRVMSLGEYGLFAPTNPYRQAALRFTSKIPIQHKMQGRQLRSRHQDDHYCAALFKYLKCKAIELQDDAILFSTDDKAKVPVGEPGTPISTGVRGRVSLAPAASELCSLDHDMKAT
ncbi:hypothetical protein MAR_027738 [Mya arenaria]|uniref:Uncharacterized protein n=1 Tax=Mya arenaria TaxID=6604 RepID=A0ABY7EUE0_MYAAR|nr:hypothetical protein MAR_027738 [Mya arenaria]